MTTPAPRPEDYARQFPENGMKLLLLESLNLHELLDIGNAPLTREMNFARLVLDPTNYVQPDYRHLQSDLVFRCPLRTKGRRSRTVLWLYILLEHQTEPDRLMRLRIIEYVVAIYRTQAREWLQTHPTTADLQLMPVLPIVFYTGSRRWDHVGQLGDLLAGGGRFASLAPKLDPVFINLRETPEPRLATSGAFGQVLRLVQGRRLPAAEFQNLLESVVRALDELPAKQRPRWQGLLSYLYALVYHEREPAEHAGLLQHIEQTVRNERRRAEVSEMRKTIADMFREEGEQRGALSNSREMLLEMLQLRFGDLPAEVTTAIENCTDQDQLKAWIKAFVNARTLAQVGIRSSR